MQPACRVPVARQPRTIQHAVACAKSDNFMPGVYVHTYDNMALAQR